MDKSYKKQNAEVLYTVDNISTVDRLEIENFKILADHNERKRVRLCAHADSNQLLHEMLIVHGRNAYVRPHKHPGKTESTHIIEGLVDIVLFTDDGKVDRVLNMGDYASGKIFYYRMDAPVFHMLIIRSNVVVFHETTNGPFNRNATVFAPWSPDDADTNSVSDFLSDLNNRLNLV